jgi:multidrug efflux pump subunit AcrB
VNFHKNPVSTTIPKDKLLPKLTHIFFRKPKTTAVIWLILVVFGATSYATLLRREGFPSIQIPIAIVTGTYVTNNPQLVDRQVVKPIIDVALAQSNVKTVQSQSAGNFFSVTIQYKEGTDGTAATTAIKNKLGVYGQLPANASVRYVVPYFGATGGGTQQIDVAVSLYAQTGNVTTAMLASKAQQAIEELNRQKVSGVKSFSIVNPFETTRSATGMAAQLQRSFDRFSYRSGGNSIDANSVLIAVAAQPNTDAIALDASVRSAIAVLNQSPDFAGYGLQVSASFAPSIKDNISELQRVLLEGLLIVLFVGSFVIAIRASLVTVLSMITVILSTLGLLFLIGYTLNVITLFALILGLSLIVDDTIIMVEAIEAARRNSKDQSHIVKTAARKVSRAMLAATLTASLSFAPFLFVGGILGTFIRAIPITIISSLIISLLVALIFIPLFSKFTLLTRKQLDKDRSKTAGTKIEAAVANMIGRPMVWAQHSRKKLTGLGLIAIVIGIGFIAAGGYIATKVVFNIFPAAKDSNQIALKITFPNDTSIVDAQKIAADVDTVANRILGKNFVKSSYFGLANSQMATSTVDLIPYSQRSVTSPQLVQQLKAAFSNHFTEAKVAVNQIDSGPPAAPFTVQLTATNRPAALKAAQDIASYMERIQLKRSSGKLAQFTDVTLPSPNVFNRSGRREIVEITANFNGTDTTTLVTLAQAAIKQKYNDSTLKQYGLSSKDISFNIGQESDNQNSFKSLAIAFPLLLIVIYLVLAFQFRSLLQPLLIFMAIPFSIFGVMGGLFITNNPISFFALLGFFALIGLSIKNTILLTDFANQSRRDGLNPVDAVLAALKERFRPLIATSLTAVLSLVPLAITSPFWEGLAVVLIFGLISSTILVLTVFPYYYLGVEFIRDHITPRKLLRKFRNS